MTLRHDGHLERYHEEWAGRFARDSDQSGAPRSVHLRRALLIAELYRRSRVRVPLQAAAFVRRFFSSTCFSLAEALCSVRCSLVNYSRLVMYSFGFQQAFQRGMCPEDEIFLTKVPIPGSRLERVFC